MEQPESYDSEKGLIGTVLLAPENVASVMGAISVEDFYHGVPQKAYAAICDLALEGKPVTVNTVAQKSGLSVDDVSAMLTGATAEEWDFWAKEVKSFSKRRDLMHAGEEAIRLAMSPADPEESLSKVTSMLLDESRESLNVRTIDESITKVMDRIDRFATGAAEVQGLKVGWETFDRMLDGLKEGTVTLVYAPTSQFKSFFVTNMAWSLGYDGVPGLMFTTEMPTDQVLQRLLQVETQINIKDARYKGTLTEHVDRLKEGADVLRTYPLYFSDRSVLDIGYLSSLVLQAKRRKNIKYVIVDLIDHISSARFKDSDIKNEQYVMQQLKDLAKRCEVAIVGTAHIKKTDYDQRKERQPVIDLEEIKGAASKYQDVDIAISLQVVSWAPDSKGNMRWVAANREERLEATQSGKAQLMCGITKNRDGELGNVLFEVDIASGGVIMPYLGKV